MIYFFLYKSIYIINIEIKKKRNNGKLKKNKVFVCINVCFIKIGCVVI